ASRAGELFGLEAPDPRAPLKQELTKLFERLQKQLGFSRPQLRAAALEVLHDEEWATHVPSPPPAEEPTAAEPPAAPGGHSCRPSPRFLFSGGHSCVAPPSRFAWPASCCWGPPGPLTAQIRPGANLYRATWPVGKG